MEDNVYKKFMVTLNERLKVCASMVRKNSRVCDIGTDHAYLPIWLTQKEIIPHSIAVDINMGPLKRAKENIIKYGLVDRIETRLSDGLDKIHDNEVDDIVIAGMGGELISEIIFRAKWLKNKNKNLILQPMTMVKHLRVFLKNENYKIHEEKAVFSDKKIYTIIKAVYSEDNFLCNDLYPYIGGLEIPLSIESKEYIKKEINYLRNQIKGLKINGKKTEENELTNTIEKLEQLIKQSIKGEME